MDKMIFNVKEPRLAADQAMRSIITASVLACALVSRGVEIVDLTAAARTAGKTYYTITASSEATTTSSAGQNRSAAGAFDGVYKDNSAKAWWTDPDVASPYDQWVIYQFNDSFASGQYIHLTHYALCFNSGWCSGYADQCKMPRDWTFEGSDDGENWTVLDTQSGHTTTTTWKSSIFGPVAFPLKTNACYRRYRLHMTAIAATDHTKATYYVIPEIQFHGELLNFEEEAKNTRYWVGGASGDWNEPSNWTLAGETATVPQAGDRVFLGGVSAVNVTLSGTMPRLAELRLGGYTAAATLTTTNWTTAVNADSVYIANAGVLTCAQSTTEGGETNRVYVTCKDFTVAKGGSVLVDACGYIAANGPGAGWDDAEHTKHGGNDMGASHGGFGGVAFGHTVLKDPTLPYGDEEAPTTLGSGGLSTKYHVGSTGGGAVYVNATGNVRVDGVISANAENTSAYGNAVGGLNHDSAGSGGSVYIVCNTFTGTNGVIRANGGGGTVLLDSGSVYNSSSVNVAGGGGRIAIRAAEPVAGRISGMTFSAAAGDYRGGHYDLDRRFYSKVTDVDKFMTDADLGTLWFSDAGFLESLGTGITGQIRNFKNVTFDTLTMTKGHVRFSVDGCMLNVLGDLIVSNDTARLEIGGDRAEILFQRMSLRSDEPVTLAVGGNLRIEEGGRLDVYSAITNGVTAWGASVSVAGDFYVGNAATVKAWSDPVNGGSATFAATDVTVASNGLLTASERGFAGGWDWPNTSVRRAYGEGPGGPKVTAVGSKYNAAAAAHGGVGGFADSNGRPATYGDEYAPMLAGSGGCCCWKYQNYGGCGGGVIHVTAKEDITVDGTVSADGMAARRAEGGGSGGSVLLYARRLLGASYGRISAIGGGSSVSYEKTGEIQCQGGTGGGGRIAIWLGFTGERLSRIKGRGLSPDVFDSLGADAYTYAGAYDVAGGTNSALTDETGLGTAGTIRYVRCESKRGAAVIVR